MTPARQLARFVATATPDPALLPIVAPAVADGMGCILAGASSAVATRVQATFAPIAPGPVPLYGTAATLAAPQAALANAVAGHAWDLDDWEEPANTHPTVVLLPALLAAAHLRSASGTALLTAYAVGAELIMRLGQALSLDHYARGFHSTATLGTLGAAAAVARLRELDEDATAHALGLAASQATGYTVQFGTNAKPLQAGFAARNGVECALLAAQGVTSAPDTLFHPRGLSGLMGAHDPNRIAAAMTRLGQPWALAEFGLILKPWPSCGYTHRLMTAAQDLRTALADRLDQITAISAEMPDFHYAILPFDRPRTRAQALFSAPACIAQTLVTGTLTLADSAAGFWQAPQVARLIPLTSVTAAPALNPALNYDPDQPDILRVTLSDGTVLETTCAAPLGHPANPMDAAALAAKFHTITNRPADQFHALLDWPAAPDIAQFFSKATR